MQARHKAFLVALRFKLQVLQGLGRSPTGMLGMVCPRNSPQKTQKKIKKHTKHLKQKKKN